MVHPTSSRSRPETPFDQDLHVRDVVDARAIAVKDTTCGDCGRGRLARAGRSNALLRHSKSPRRLQLSPRVLDARRAARDLRRDARACALVTLAAEIAAVLIRDHGFASGYARAAAAAADGSVVKRWPPNSRPTEARETAKLLHSRLSRDPSVASTRTDLAARSHLVSYRDHLAGMPSRHASLVRDLEFSSRVDPRRCHADCNRARALRRLPAAYPARVPAIDEALAALERNASPKVVADWVVLQL